MGHRGRSWAGVLRLDPRCWGDQDVERLAAGLDVPLERRTTVSTAARLRREFPGVMPWRLAHLGATTLGAVLAIVLAI
ncbi:MAG: hypothetical protein Q8K79_23325 [Solirubrobacteraceae bacterium]|nr:hypothetical protein [Solirubrobacteraceae bacterium]